ncbi:uncharacterized protein LOC101900268 [Musca domestica]|uniref:Uncharacterized protein LOC101900268 n=1 Tax=Musca domestica TaxID=7370 RepID=A0A1I8N4Q8_MUSDO|nr:uncharacterized protein LOC101900268 [Musca domestica]
MRNYFYGLFALLLFGLMSFSEGKPCPGRTRPHKTRCDAYYKCTEINDQKHVWVPAKCEEGLIYEHSLGVCVLPADDWECGLNATADTNRNPPSRSSPSANKDADFYVVTNAREELEAGHRRNDKFDDGKVEIVIGTGVSSEEVEGGDALYDGSGNGGELVQLDDLINVENREANDVVMLKDKEEAGGEVIKPEMHEVLLDAEKKEELNEVLETIKTKAEIGQPSSNIDPKLTAHLQRLSQLVEGLKQTYQNSDTPSQDLRPDQLNAFLAHFNIKNKFENLEPHGEEEEKDEMAPVIVKGMNKTGAVKKDNIKKLNPETKVVLSNILPKRYQQLQHGGNDGGYSNSQIVVNRPEGAVLFALPQSQGEHHFVERPEYSSDNSPKISEDTLKTVLELSKQMIASQNIPSVIHNPAYYAPPIMQPIVLTQSPFSTDYYGARPPPALHHGGNGDDDGNEGGYSSVFSSDHHYHGYKSHKKPPRKTSHDKSPATTIIHNNVIPLHLTSTGGSQGSVDKLDSYGQNLNLYPPLDSQEERPDNLVGDGYAGGNGKPVYENNKYGIRTTRRPSGTTTTQMPSYGHTIRPNDFHPTSHSFNKYFTPSEHLNNQNVNSIFQTTDNYGNLLPRPSSQQGQSQSSSYSETDNSNNYGTANQGYEQSMFSEDHLQQHQPQYPNSVDEEDTDMIQYTFGNPKPSHAEGNLQMQQYSGSQSVFSSNNNNNNHYMPRPSGSSPANNMMYNPSAISTNSYNPSSSSANAYNPLLSLSSSSSSSSSSNVYNPLTALSYSGSSSGNKYPNKAGTQLVNIGGNFISIDAFQNSILPLMGGNAQAAPNVEVITCAAGVRQPNTTDCTRYYVCSKKDGKVLSYSCPPYTAFNADTRICDARTYALCSPDNEVPQTYSVNENKRLQMEALKAMQEAKRKQQQQQQQMQQQQQLANILQQYTMQSAASASMNSNTNPMLNSYNSPTGSDEQNMLQSYMQQNSAASLMPGTTARPQLTPTKSKKRKYYCKEGDKIPDQTSISSYFVCYKNAQGQMKGHKMTCSKGLLFCPKTTMCTLPSKCS